MANRLGEILVSEALVSADAVERALAQQNETSPRARLGEVLVEMGCLDERWLLAALALQAGVETVDPLALAVEPALLWRVPRDVAERLGAFVARADDGRVVVVSDPARVGTGKTMASLLGVGELPVVAGLPDRVYEAIRRHYDTTRARARRVRGVLGEQRPPMLSPTGMELDTKAMLLRLRRPGPRPIQDFATAILVHAVESGAERVVLDRGVLSTVYDGVETHLLELPAVQASALAAQFRASTQLEAGALRAQAASTLLMLGEHEVGVVAQSEPGASGGRVELRFDEGAAMGGEPMAPKVATAWARLCSQPGLVLLAGAEPAVGEVPPGADVRVLRDPTGVARAVDAARSRLVFGRVAGSGAADALASVREWTPSRAGLAAVVRGVLVSSRLRRVCDTCALPPVAEEEAAERLGVVTFAAPRVGRGCPACVYRGYAGSVYARELVVVDPALRDALGGGAALSELGVVARPLADRSLQIDAVALAIGGATTVAEIERVVPPLPAWAVRPREDRHRGLFRAVTDVERAPAAPSDVAPLVLLVHPGEGARSDLAASLGGKAVVHAVRTVAAARASTDPEPPAVGVLASFASGGWDPALIEDWRARGARVVLLGTGRSLTELAEAFALGADDYASSLDEAATRVARQAHPRAQTRSASFEAAAPF